MKFCLLLLLCGSVASAHVISMSSGEAVITGNRLAYTLRMPDYEIANLHHPEQALLDRIAFTSGSDKGSRTSQECHHDPASVNVVCTAAYEFTSPVRNLGVDCSFYEVTVANHIHILRAERDGKSDRAILDSGFRSTTLTFRPPTAAEKVIEQLIAGVVRTVTNWSELLLLAALAIASRTRRELIVLSLVFVAADAAATFLLPRLSAQPTPRFTEEAAALALAYLAFEIFFFPNSRGRSLFAILFGAFAGLYLATFITESRYPAQFVLTGSAVTVLLLAVLFGAISAGLSKLHAKRFAAAALFVSGCTWFALRLIA